MNEAFQRATGWLPPEALGRAPHTGLKAAAAGGGFSLLRPEVRVENVPDDVYDQHSVGRCTADSAACAIETLLPRSGYPARRPCRRRLYRRTRDRIGTGQDDSGGMISDTVSVLMLEGWETEESEPSPVFDDSYREHAPLLGVDAPKLVSAEALDFDPFTIALELDAGHVVLAGIQITGDWHRAWGSHALPEPSGSIVGNHAVLLTGYSIPRRCWVMRNSWGRAFGIMGNILLPWRWTEPPYCGELFAVRVARFAEASS